MARRHPSDYRYESELIQDVLLEFGSGKPMRVFRRNVGKAYPVSMKSRLMQGESCRPVSFGTVGEADIGGILFGDPVTKINRGRALGWEGKLLGEKLRPDQVTWRDMFISAGGLYILFTCIEDVYRGLEAEGIQCR